MRGHGELTLAPECETRILKPLNCGAVGTLTLNLLAPVRRMMDEVTKSVSVRQRQRRWSRNIEASAASVTVERLKKHCWSHIFGCEGHRDGDPAGRPQWLTPAKAK